MSRAVIVAGMHRSGTSLMAGLIRRLGVDLGDRLIRADACNKHGYHEDADIVGFHGRIFRSLLPRGSQGHADWGWSESAELDRSGLQEFRPTALRLAAARAARSTIWGFKDPRVTLLLDFWDSCLPEARYVLVYRAPWLVADSMQRLKANLFRRHPGYAAPIWTVYNRSLLDFYRRNRARSLLVNIDALPGALERLKLLTADRLGLESNGIDLSAGFDASLLARGTTDDPRANLTTIAYPACSRLYAELEAEADLPGPPWQTARQPGIRLRQSATPTLSVIMPTHNDASLLLDALASLERANVSDAEVIVVDDGTSDPESRRILAALATAGQRIVRTPNRGLAAARNTGIAAASARYLLTLDADNRLLPGFAEAATAILDSDPRIGIVHSGWQLFGDRTGVVPGEPFRIERMAYGNSIDACAVFRRSMWAELGGYHEPMTGFEDWEFWLHAHSRGWGFQLMSGPGFDYRVRPGSLIRRSNRVITRHGLRQLILDRHTDLLGRQMPRALRRCSLAFFLVLPKGAAVRGQRWLTQCWYHLIWELFHNALGIGRLWQQALELPAERGGCQQGQLQR